MDQLKNFRSFGGVQSYPSRTKDSVDVDFSTGSVGLGCVFARLRTCVPVHVFACELLCCCVLRASACVFCYFSKILSTSFMKLAYLSFV